MTVAAYDGGGGLVCWSLRVRDRVPTGRPVAVAVERLSCWCRCCWIWAAVCGRGGGVLVCSQAVRTCRQSVRQE